MQKDLPKYRARCIKASSSRNIVVCLLGVMPKTAKYLTQAEILTRGRGSPSKVSQEADQYSSTNRES